MDDEDETDFDYMAPEVITARNAIGKAISEYLNIIRPDDNPYPVAWIAAAEWTNTELEQTGRAGRDVISPNEQSISASCGLGHYIGDRFA
jgi:hypothetical protein